MEKYCLLSVSGRPLMFRLCVVCFFCVMMVTGLASGSQAQTVLGARQLAMGQAVTAVGDDSWAVFGNPALLAGTDNAVSFYGIRNYGFAELTDQALAATVQLRGVTLGGGLHTFGDDLYRETRVRAGLGYAQAGVSAGLIVNYTHLHIKRYGSAGTPTIDAGLAWQLVPELKLGARVLNLNRGSVGKAREELARELAIGLAYELAERVKLAADAVKDVRFPLAFRAGLEIPVWESLQLRGGITTAPQTFSAGAGFATSLVSVNFVAQQHYALGWSPGLDLTIFF
ncbi:hypothetical protein CYPRO_0322 [Cyclonatronum proteinivorum]|uniref:PorV/PorQ family protein n=1 Tax=Cyclonatronum proteinivorum TaxID=1457365 RepID=A0A345UGK8_9BACT|nr:hypothetical protein [Cyclonatronum proteinivorum]AXI99609.1 hypothetical protein CYPRO_0322 [Cyclonatronum proteinivorum]